MAHSLYKSSLSYLWHVFMQAFLLVSCWLAQWGMNGRASVLKACTSMARAKGLRLSSWDHGLPSSVDWHRVGGPVIHAHQLTELQSLLSSKYFLEGWRFLHKSIIHHEAG